MRATLRRWVELHPLLWAALLAVAAVAAADGQVVAGAGICVLALPAILLARRVDILVAAVVLTALAAGLHVYRVVPQRAAQREVEAAGSIPATVTARLLSGPQGTGGGWAALAEIEGGGPKGKVWWRGIGPSPGKGARIEARGRLLPFPKQRNPGEFDVARWLFRQGAWGVFEADGLAKRLEEPPALDQAADQARAWFRDAVTAGLDPQGQEAAVIRAMVLGEMPENEDVLIEAYRQSGTLHVFSVSGMHVAMVGLIVWWLLRLWVPRRVAIFVIVAAMLGYVWITGMKAPSIRAVMMATVVLGAFVWRQRPDLLNALGLALLAALLADGHQLFQVGTQLSFGVVAAIGIGAAGMRRYFAFLETKEPYLPRQLYGFWRNAWLKIRQKAASAMGASSAASMGSLPLTLWHFGFVSWVSVVASPLIGLPVLLLMILALTATALAPFLPAAQQQVNRLNGGVAWVCTKLATGFAAIPGGNLNLPRDRPGEDFLIVYDAGHGSGAACLHDGESSVLFDMAHRPGFRRTVLPSLRHLALRPQSIVLSHPDGGHVGGTVEALDALPVRQILLPVERARSTAFREVVTVSRKRGIATTRGREGSKYDVSPDVWFEVLHEPDAGNQNAVADNRVMITRLHWHGWRVLFTSDAGLATERALLEAAGDLRADVIVAGRHRNDASLGDDFLAAVQPKAIIAGHADFPQAERVPEDWMAACEKRGMRVFHQGRTGAVTLVVGEDGSLVIRGFLDGSELRLRR